MRFWDASAIVPLLVAEPSTKAMQAQAEEDPDILVWWGSEMECASALCRLERMGVLETSALALALSRLKQLAGAWHEVEPSDVVRDHALRFLRVHPLRAADAMQLAAAFVAAEMRPSTLAFLTLDERLAEAAGKEGFALVVSDAP
jgi:predicted nucleic acid-binding protein